MFTAISEEEEVLTVEEVEDVVIIIVIDYPPMSGDRFTTHHLRGTSD